MQKKSTSSKKSVILIIFCAVILLLSIGIFFGYKKYLKKPAKVNFLYSQIAESGKLTAKNGNTFTLTLNNVSPLTVVFSERPVRKSFTIDTAVFVATFRKKLGDKPVNAAIVFKSKDSTGKIDTAVFLISEPNYDKNSKTLTYTVVDISINGKEKAVTYQGEKISQLPNEFGSVSLFIDSLGENDDPSSYTGYQDGYADFLQPKQLLDWDIKSDGSAKYYEQLVIHKTPAPRQARTDVYQSSIPRILGFMNYDSQNQPGINPVQIAPTNSKDRSIYPGWNFIDVYVSGISSGCCQDSAAISVPTPQEIEIGHKNGIPVLGSLMFLTGAADPSILSDEPDLAVSKLIAIAEAYHFDGWFFDMENGDPGYTNLVQELKNQAPQLMILWYDAGCELNKNNEGYFDITNGYFVDYCWKYNPSAMSTSGKTAGSRSKDVYMGVNWWTDPDRFSDIEALQTFNTSLDEQGNPDPPLSLALWAMMWPDSGSMSPSEAYLSNQNPNVETYLWPHQYPPNNSSDCLGKFATPKTPIVSLPFQTNFNVGKGEQMFDENGNGDNTPWGNLLKQDFMPHFLIWDTQNQVNVHFDFTTAINSGSSLEIQNSSFGNYNNNIPIYLTFVDVNNQNTVSIKYKSNGNVVFYLKYADGSMQNIVLPSTANTWEQTSVNISNNTKLYEIGISSIAANSTINIGEIIIQ